MNLTEEIKKLYREGSILIRLIIINLAVFLSVNVIELFFHLLKRDGSFVVYWLTSTSSLSELLFRPWSVITYMFLHQDFFHIFFNMVFFFFAGRIFMDYLGSRRLLSTYILGGISGLLLYILAYNIFPVFEDQVGAPILGASASVMATFIAIAMYKPNFPVYLLTLGPIRLKYIAIFYFILDFVRIKENINPGGHIAHLGGAIYGYLFILQLRKGIDFSKRFEIAIRRFIRLFSTRKRMKVAHSKRRAKSDVDYNKEKVEEQKRIDAILDKISKSGYESLTKKEKEILFRASNK